MSTFKLFPNRPPARVIDLIEETLGLPTEVLKKANAWLRDSDILRTLNFQEALFHAEQDTDLSTHELSRILSVIFQIGVMIEDEESFESAIADLSMLEFGETQIENFRTLMNGVRFPERARFFRLARAANSAIPTIRQSSAVCDLRAVFEEDADPDANVRNVGNLQALVPVVIISLDVYDDNGESRSVVIQFSETDFKRFNRMIANAERQLERIIEIGQQTSFES